MFVRVVQLSLLCALALGEVLPTCDADMQLADSASEGASSLVQANIRVRKSDDGAEWVPKKLFYAAREVEASKLAAEYAKEQKEAPEKARKIAVEQGYMDNLEKKLKENGLDNQTQIEELSHAGRILYRADRLDQSGAKDHWFKMTNYLRKAKRTHRKKYNGTFPDYTENSTLGLAINQTKSLEQYAHPVPSPNNATQLMASMPEDEYIAVLQQKLADNGAKGTELANLTHAGRIMFRAGQLQGQKRKEFLYTQKQKHRELYDSSVLNSQKLEVAIQQSVNKVWTTFSGQHQTQLRKKTNGIPDSFLDMPKILAEDFSALGEEATKQVWGPIANPGTMAAAKASLDTNPLIPGYMKPSIVR